MAGHETRLGCIPERDAAGAAFGSLPNMLGPGVWSLLSESFHLAFGSRAEAGGKMVLCKKTTAGCELVVADSAPCLDKGFKKW